MKNLPTQQRGHALELCDATTGHTVQAIAFCDSEERAHAIIKALRAYPELVAALRKAKEALYNVPIVGRKYDQQHSDTHTRAALEIDTLLNTL